MFRNKKVQTKRAAQKILSTNVLENSQVLHNTGKRRFCLLLEFQVLVTACSETDRFDSGSGPGYPRMD